MLYNINKLSTKLRSCKEADPHRHSWSWGS